MHMWGDEEFDWKGLDKAIIFIHTNLRRFGRIGVHSKEKYGTARISCYFVVDLHSLTHPGYVYSQYPNWLWKLDVQYGDRLLKYTGLFYLIFTWQKFVYVQTYKEAVKRWPHIKEEILCDADQLKWLEKAGLCKVSDYWDYCTNLKPEEK